MNSEPLIPTFAMILDGRSIDPRFTSPEEPEFVDSKILAFWPDSTPINDKRYHAMLIEGIAQFSTSFGTDSQDSLEVIRTDSALSVVCQVEEEAWFSLTFTIDPKFAVEENFLRSYLKSIVSEFKLLHRSVRRPLLGGPIPWPSEDVAEDPLEVIKMVCQDFLSQVLGVTFRNFNFLHADPLGASPLLDDVSSEPCPPPPEAGMYLAEMHEELGALLTEARTGWQVSSWAVLSACPGECCAQIGASLVCQSDGWPVDSGKTFLQGGALKSVIDFLTLMPGGERTVRKATQHSRRAQISLLETDVLGLASPEGRVLLPATLPYEDRQPECDVVFGMGGRGLVLCPRVSFEGLAEGGDGRLAVFVGLGLMFVYVLKEVEGLVHDEPAVDTTSDLDSVDSPLERSFMRLKRCLRALETLLRSALHEDPTLIEAAALIHQSRMGMAGVSRHALFSLSTASGRVCNPRLLLAQPLAPLVLEARSDLQEALEAVKSENKVGNGTIGVLGNPFAAFRSAMGQNESAKKKFVRAKPSESTEAARGAIGMILGSVERLERDGEKVLEIFAEAQDGSWTSFKRSGAGDFAACLSGGLDMDISSAQG